MKLRRRKTLLITTYNCKRIQITRYLLSKGVLILMFSLVVLIYKLYEPPAWYTKSLRELASKYGIDFSEFDSCDRYKKSALLNFVIVISAVLLHAFTSLFDYKIVFIIYFLIFIISYFYSGGFLLIEDGKSPLKKYNDTLLRTAYKLYDRTYFPSGIYWNDDPILEEDLDKFSSLLGKCQDYISYCKLKKTYYLVYYLGFLALIFSF